MLRRPFSCSMNKKIIILIDGGFLRVKTKHAGKTYTPEFIERFAHQCKLADEDIFRILFPHLVL